MGIRCTHVSVLCATAFAATRGNARTVVAEGIAPISRDHRADGSDSSLLVNALGRCNRLAFPRSGQK